MSNKPKKLFIAVIAFGVIGAGLYWRQPLAQATMKIFYGLSIQRGLVGYWNFDDCDACTTAADKSGNGNTGTMYDDVTAANLHTAGGKIGNGISLDGSNDYVALTQSEILKPTGAFTVSAWVKRTANMVTWSGIYSSPEATNSTGGFFLTGLNTNIIRLYIDTSGAGGWATADSATVLAINQWYHVAATWSGSSASIYIDGVLDNTPVSIASMGYGTTARNAEIGRYSAYGNFPGLIDDARIYNRALSADEIKYLADQRDDRLRPSNRNGMVAYWNFDDCDSCSTVTDKTGNGSTGTFAGAAARTNGKRGKGLSLSGAAGTRVTVPSAADSITDLTGPMSVSFWFYPQSDVGVIISKQKNLKNYPWEVLTHPTANDIRIGTDDGTNGTLNTATGALTGKQNQWHHGVLIVNGTARQFYLDNALIIDVTSAQSNLRSTDDAIWFGDRSGNADLPWNGLLDEVRIYNRALSADEVARLYEEDSYRTTINANQNESFNNGLVGMWSFNGPDVDWASTTAEILDRSGNGNNGDAVSLTNNDARAGIVGQAMNFDGVGDYVSAGTTNIPTGTSPRTIALWMYQRTNTAQNALVALETTTGNSFTLVPLNSGGTYYIFTDSVSISFTVSAADHPPLNSWNHFVISWDSTTFRYYLNGTLRSSEAYSEATGPLSVVGIGRRAQGASGYFDGLLDDVRIYNRALNATEIQELYLSSARR